MFEARRKVENDPKKQSRSTLRQVRILSSCSVKDTDVRREKLPRKTFSSRSRPTEGCDSFPSKSRRSDCRSLCRLGDLSRTKEGVQIICVRGQDCVTTYCWGTRTAELRGPTIQSCSCVPDTLSLACNRGVLQKNENVSTLLGHTWSSSRLCDRERQ